MSKSKKSDSTKQRDKSAERVAKQSKPAIIELSQEELDQRFADLASKTSSSDEVAAKLGQKKVKSNTAPKFSGGNKYKSTEAIVLLLQEIKRPMDTHEMLEELGKRGWWTTGAKKPADVLFGVMVSEIKRKGAASRFVKTSPGKFDLVATA